MTSATPHRARSAEAKKLRERAILDAARALASERSVREVTLTDVAAAVGMHKSAMLRYFETREQIFLALTAAGWHDWSATIRTALPETSDASTVAAVLARTLSERPLFCDLLAQAPLNLERNVSFETVRAYKLAVLAEVGAIADDLERSLGLDGEQAVDVVATATSLAGALWQMAAPGTRLREFYESSPELAHAVVHVEPRLARILEALIDGFLRSPAAAR
ncbi:TetR family transcriptional regulator [Actinoplanes bogorensis]|uniref:TetR family transcriptional regulator n=1 Tax=Paractinoplanes bogorensis TaxID=1610840 RepID=A0ABS5YRQ9_9ACTN|nr:TetR family transcriptional regulator [Actinoplanes bogorensis]MBU2664710.1 TetR family transcriptional regulator [Actinoplanes bogorensis]